MLRRKVSVEPPCEPTWVASFGNCLANSRISRAWAQLWASGFSQKTCLPACMARLLIGHVPALARGDHHRVERLLLVQQLAVVLVDLGLVGHRRLARSFLASATWR